MKKIAIGWLGINKDFINDEVNQYGPTANFLRYHWHYDKYIMLFMHSYYPKALKFKKFIEKTLPNVKLVLKIIDDIENVHQDIPTIKYLTENILLEYRNLNIDIFLSTGSGTMKIVWYILHTTLGLKTRLIQILRPEESRNPIFPDLVEVKVEGRSTIPVSAIIREKIIEEQTSRQEPILTPTIEKVYKQALKIAQTGIVHVLIIGNTGTGKELLAKYIHCNSPRRRKEYRTVNTAAMSDQLLESRLFGYKKGCFTGANKDFKGIFEQADGGTVFLDEIGDISPYTQQALLRLLQEKEIQPLCGRPKKVNVRIIAATNKNIYEQVKKGLFRADLFHRLGIMLKLPNFKDYPVKEKEKFIFSLLERKKEQYINLPIPQLDKTLLDFLLTYDYPGNIRELDNILDYLIIFSEGKKATVKHLPPYINYQKTPLAIKELERIHIEKVLKMFNYNKTRTAKTLGIALNTLKNKIREYKIIIPK